MTQVVNIFKDEYDVYIGRAGKGNDGYYGNPIDLWSEDRRWWVIEQFKKYFYDRLECDEEFRTKVQGLKGKRLGCFCYPKLCHGMVYIEYLEGISIEDQMKQIEKGMRDTSDIPSLFDELED